MRTRAEIKAKILQQVLANDLQDVHHISEPLVSVLSEIIKDQHKEIISLKDLIGESLE